MKKQIRVLIVEDSESDAALDARALERAGYEVSYERVEDADQIKAALNKQAWDVVIMDHFLPQMDSFKALKLLKESGQDIPVIVVSGAIGEETAVMIMKAGAHDYLMKSNLTRLAPAVERELRDFEILRQRKQAAEALQESEQKYRLLADNASDIIWTMDINMRFTYMSPSVERVRGYTVEEVMAQSLEEVFTPSSVEMAVKAFKEEIAIESLEPKDLSRVRTLELEHICKDGSTIWVEVKASFIRDTNGQAIGILGVSREITERRRAEEERRQLQLKAQIASRLASVGEMAAGVAHEINNPLTGVLGYAKLLMDRDDIPLDVRNSLKVITEGARRIAGIVQRLLIFSRQAKPERRYVNLNELIESTLILRAYSLKVNNIKVETRLAPGSLETVVDPGQIQQVLLNLIINAEKEMKLAHGEGELTITTEKTDNTIKVSIKDNGPGIKPEAMDKIFDPFFTTRDIGQGTGLGLSLCYGIVAEHSGKIYAESQPGKGATFIVELPLITEVIQSESAEPPVEHTEKVAKAKIMVVDDERDIRDLVKQVLTEEGYEVEAIDNAEDALKKIESQRYDLVLLDIKMPGMNGVELYRRIQKIAKPLAKRVIFITGDIMSADTQKFLSETKVIHIDKPFDSEQLSREVRRGLGEGR